MIRNFPPKYFSSFDDLTQLPQHEASHIWKHICSTGISPTNGTHVTEGLYEGKVSVLFLDLFFNPSSLLFCQASSITKTSDLI